jgi:hypothetical protein
MSDHYPIELVCPKAHFGLYDVFHEKHPLYGWAIRARCGICGISWRVCSICYRCTRLCFIMRHNFATISTMQTRRVAPFIKVALIHTLLAVGDRLVFL